MKELLKKQKLFFISLAGIVIISMALMTTFAYQTLSVDIKDGSSDELAVKAGVLDVSFAVSRRISIKNMPLIDDYVLADYTEFTVDNTKSTEDVYYKVSLVDLEYSNSLKTKDFKYTLVDVTNNKNDILGEYDFRDLEGNTFDLVTNFGDYIGINSNEKETLRLYLWLKEEKNDQNYLENSFFKGKIEIDSYLKKDIGTSIITDFKIFGNTLMNGDNDIVSIDSIGTLINDNNSENYGKYEIIININNDGIEELYPIYINSPLMCLSEDCDYIDVINRKVVRKVGSYKVSGKDSWTVSENKDYDIYSLDLGINTDYAISTHFYNSTDLNINNFNINNGILNIVYSTKGNSNIDSFKEYINNNNIYVYYLMEQEEDVAIDLNTSKILRSNDISVYDIDGITGNIAIKRDK